MEYQNKRKYEPIPRHMGMVKNWNNERGFGFVYNYDDKQSYFVHRSQLVDDYELVKGSIIEFEIWTDRNDPDKHFAAKVLICELPEEKPRGNQKKPKGR